MRRRSGYGGVEAAGGEADHEACPSGHDHADADEGADDPEGTCGPMSPHHDSKDEGDDAVEENPSGAGGAALLKVRDKIEDAFDDKEDTEDECESGNSLKRMHDEADADAEVEKCDDYFPDDASCSLGLEGVHELKASTEDEQPADDEHEAEGGGERKSDGKKSEDDEENCPDD